MLAIGHLIGLVKARGWRQEAAAAAERALELDSQDSDVLGYAGCAIADMGDLSRGIGIMRRALELDPSNAQAHAALGSALLQTGDEAGIAEMRHGMRISPRDNRLGAWGALFARALLGLGKVEEAIEVAEHACRCDDKIVLPRLVLAVARCLAGNMDAARAAINDARRIMPGLQPEDITSIAGPDEINALKQTGLL